MRTARGRRFARRQPIVYKAPRVGGALIHQQMPRYDYRDAYQVVVMAPPEAVWDAVMQLDFLDLTALGAFTVVSERSGREIVLGAVGQPWRPDYGPTPTAASAFAGFDRPGFAKIAWSWMVKPIGSGQTLLVIEWRTQLTDDEARSNFRRYWTIASRGVRLLARVALARIKADCEQPTTSPGS